MHVRGRAVTLAVTGVLLLPLGVGLAWAAEPSATPPTVTIDAQAGKDGRRPLSRPLRVSVAGGTLQSVVGTATPIGVRDSRRAAPVTGTFTPSYTAWRSAALMPARFYRLRVTAVGPDGTVVTRSAWVRSAKPRKTLVARTSPRSGTVGVGMPITVDLSRPVTRTAARRAVQAALTVSTSRPISAGSWGWVSSQRLEFRPRTFWPANTTVTVRASLAGLGIGRGVWAVKDSTTRFRVGRAQVMTVDGRRHTFVLKRNGKVIRRGGVSLGKSGFTTRSGTKVIMTRELSRRMRSTTVGIPSGANSYDLQVPYAMRLTNTGEFVHGAPWNSHIGVANVSHGCTNLTLDNARWLYHHSLLGDPVITRGTGRPSELGNGLGGVWNVGWAKWKALSAI